MKGPITLLVTALVVFVFTGAGQKEWLNYKPGDTYPSDWKKVEKFENEGLPKSAQDVVRQIYRKAKQDRNHVQQIKAVIHLLKYIMTIEEEGLVKSIDTLEAETAAAEFPAKPVMQSLLADFYWGYYQNNRWKFYNRTEVADTVSPDIRTWSLQKLLRRVTDLYAASLSNTDSLQRTKLEWFDDVLNTEKNSKIYRPSLYDFLAHRAFDFYRNDENNLIKPVEEFELDDLRALAPAGEFIRAKFSTPDSASMKFKAVTLLQEMIRCHIDDSDPTALTDIDLIRLEYAREKAVPEDKDDAYLKTLNELEQSVRAYPIAAQVSYVLADYYFNQPEPVADASTDIKKTSNRKIAYDIAEKAASRFPKSRGAANCQALMDRIREKYLSVSLESTVPPQTPFRMMVEYRNVTNVFLRLVRLDYNQYMKSQNKEYDDRWEYYSAIKPLKAWPEKLPDPGDYINHRLEMKMDGLPLGFYAVLISADPSFKRKNNTVSVTPFWITNLSLVSENSAEFEGKKMFVMHSVTGEPLADVNVRSFYNIYDYNSRTYVWKSGPDFTTDEDGMFIMKGSENYYYYRFELKQENDFYAPLENFYIYQYKREKERDQIATKIFTDRSIYRPGQTVYFKGIIIKSDPKGLKHEVLPNKKTTVVFYDVNYQKISERSLITNAYGSFSGSFVTPTDRLNGQMHIQNESGSAYFSVEEYKRPKFEVEIKPVSKGYKLNEEVEVTGTAKAYAGSVVDNAKVQYRVVRRASFPYWYWWWGYRPTVPDKEITHGTTFTDSKGEFKVRFTAKPDKSIPPSQYPQFEYIIYADVTDVNGETRSGQSWVKIGYIALSASLDFPETVNKADTLKIRFITTNLNGEFEPAEGGFKIYKLEQPERILRSRLWADPDQFIIPKEDYVKWFTNDIYADEANWSKWKRSAALMDRRVDTKTQKELQLPEVMTYEPGIYYCVFDTKDRYGTTVKAEKYFTVFANESGQSNQVSPFYLIPVKTGGEPGEKARFIIGSAYETSKIFYRIEHQNKIVYKEWLTLNKEQKVIEIPIEEKHRGGLAVHWEMVRHNRLYTQTNNIYVPWTNKDLKIEMASFRDKLQPGANEQWKLIIRGALADKVAAELVATLYDASLDVFRPHYWSWYLMPSFYSYYYSLQSQSFKIASGTAFGYDWNKYREFYSQSYDQLNLFGLYFSYGYYHRKDFKRSMKMDSGGKAELPLAASEEFAGVNEGEKDMISIKTKKNGGDDKDEKQPPPPPKLTNGHSTETTTNDGGEAEDLSGVKIRTNLNETAFFYPHLATNENGEIILSFTIPEALTRWKFMALAHTKDLKIGQIQKTVVTQKDLMVQPNPPRFVRDGDILHFAAKVSNITDTDMTAVAQLQLFDAVTMQPVQKLFELKDLQQTVKIDKQGSAALSWKMVVPKDLQAFTYRVVAKAGDFSDGEEGTVPILPNAMLVIETMPLPIRGKQKKNFTFTKLLESGKSSTLRHERFTLEMTSNPAWYAVQALPYMMEYPYECTEQTFSRIYANSISTHIANSNPKIKRVFESWKDTKALLSNLEKNQELKYLLLQETPWVLDGQDETTRKKRLGLLFDLNMMNQSLKTAVKKLSEAQTSNGGWPWFTGMPDDRYITQHILTGFGHLKAMGVKSDYEDKIDAMCQKAVPYIDARMKEDYENLIRYKIPLNQNNLGYTQLHYLYTRSFYSNQKLESKYQEAYDYWKQQAQQYWLKWNYMAQAMIALGLHRAGDQATPKAIMKSIKEHALTSEEMGMYWNHERGYYWYNAPIETQTYLIEAFDEVMNDQESVEAMKVWLLKQKQTQDWKTTKATAEACYALLRRGVNLLASDQLVEVSLGGEKVEVRKQQLDVEKGTGYYKTSWMRDAVKPSMGKIKVEKKDEGVAWGAVYWQYFESLDKITPSETPLKLNKKLFLQKNTDKGPVLEPITDNNVIKVGDLVKVRIELKVDRAMEYIHMKDMRAAGMEPVNVLSRYKYQDGLGYYETTKDASTNFFISWLPKGTYVFEYPLRASLKGEFQNGITTIQCMYAPEFSSHSEGIKIRIE